MKRLLLRYPGHPFWGMLKLASGWALAIMGAVCVGFMLWQGGAWAVADGVLLLWFGYRQGSDDTEELRESIQRIERHFGKLGPRSIERDD